MTKEKEKKPKVFDIECSTCHMAEGTFAPCPYAEEINGDEDECDCCENCRQSCIEAI